jgi:hypothetical protein
VDALVNAPKKPGAKRIMEVKDPSLEKGELKAFSGSRSDDFNRVLLSEVANALWTKNSSEEWQAQQLAAVAGALRGIEPKDELEGMLAAQAMAAHHAAMECYRRAMLPEQTFEGWKEQLNQANKLSRTYATLLEALNRRRGTGQQKISVEHVHVHCRWPGHSRRGRGRGWGGERKPGTRRCNSHYPCTCRPAVGRRPDAGARAGRRRCRTGDAGCTAERRPELRRGRLTGITATGASPRRRSPAGAN